ncbi:MAG: hypothetical protein FJW79_03335 [Actinobacteria bacterium]|nr:hypothetical protein [Actinomycetota bacterium]
MGWLERRLFRINERLACLAEEERLAAAELEMHRHLDDDARRDAGVTGNPIDREDARDTAADVARFEQLVAGAQKRRRRLEAKRDRLLARLG